MKKIKIPLMILTAVLVIVVSVAGTLAYLTSVDTVVNTFTVGNVSISLDETKVTPDGKAVQGADRVKENTYHLIPGATYIKDPMITVEKGSEEAYVRMLVTVNCYDKLTAIFGTPFLPQYFVSGWDETTWITTEEIDVDTQTNTATYEFRYKEPVKPQSNSDLELDSLFDTFNLPGTVTGEQLKTISNLKITVVGHAIQKSGFADEDTAWENFDIQMSK